MAKQPQSLININGQSFDARSVQMPPSGRLFRDAWSGVNNGVIEVDMAKAKELHVDMLIDEAAAEAAAEDRAAKKSTAMRDGAGARKSKDRAAKLRGEPKTAGAAAIANAQTPEELEAVKVDNLF